MKTHIQLPKSRKNRRALVCGSPERAQWFAGKLERPREVAKNREYHSYTGMYRGQDILVISHGVGAAGASICFQELIDAGAEAMVRIGTAGGFYSGSRVGDIVVPTAAVRKDGVTLQMVPPEYPAIADPELARAVFLGTKSDNDNSVRVRSGIILTTDVFYPGPLGNDYAFFAKTGVVAVEMECSALFLIAHLRGVRAAAALVLDGSPLSRSNANYDPRPKRLAASMEVALAAGLTALAAQ